MFSTLFVRIFAFPLSMSSQPQILRDFCFAWMVYWCNVFINSMPVARTKLTRPLVCGRAGRGRGKEFSGVQPLSLWNIQGRRLDGGQRASQWQIRMVAAYLVVYVRLHTVHTYLSCRTVESRWREGSPSNAAKAERHGQRHAAQEVIPFPLLRFWIWSLERYLGTSSSTSG